MEYFSLTDIKKKNLSEVFHYIYHHSGSSKQTIATALSMSLPTVTQHLNTLLNEGLIEKSGQLSSSVGRKAAAYSIISTARIAIGVEILSRHVYITALNLFGKKESKEKIALKFQPEETYFEELKNQVFSFMRRNHFQEKQILGIGLGIQGLTSRDGREVIYGRVLNCTGLTIDMFEKYFSVPCKFIHDSECASNSDLWESPDINDAVYLSLGYHLGGAIFINGELQMGLTGKSGTFEHMTLIPGGKECYCGKKGCAECYCSGYTLIGDTDSMELEEFFEKKAQGDTACMERWQDYLKHLSMMIHNLHLVIESTVILGGHITPYFSEEDLASVRRQVLEMSTFQDSTDYIVPGRCRSDAVSIGAALPFIKEFLEKIGAEA